jgi:alpha-1,3-rhamnosyl/mannosyltransferase
VTVHDAIPWRFPDLYPAGRLGAPRRRLEASIARRAAIVITGSRTAADDLMTTLGVRAGVITVIPYAGDPTWTESSDAAAVAVRAMLGLPERYVVMSGGFVHPDPRKRLEDGVDALSTLPADVGLAITGREGPLSAPLLARARAAGLGQRVRLTGLLKTADLSALFRGAAVFVFPSLWEGFGLPLLDAFRAGTPAVISDGGALPEVAGGAAIVYPVGDVAGLASGVRAILDDPCRANEWRAAGLARARDFSHDTVLAAHTEVYESL